jgi:2-dehydro-3-deoxygluconokinase
MGPVVTLGEIMLRLAPPAHERFLQSPQFVATFGGGEANVAVALCSLGHPASFLTALPDNPLGDACIGELRRFGVGTSGIVRRPGRLGVYYLEHGANQRPSKVVYDRENSSIAQAQAAEFDWSAAFAGAAWFHITGITPALSASAAALSRDAMQAARDAGVPISIDLNYRKNLWKWGRPATEIMPELVRLAGVVIANEEDLQKTLAIETSIDVHAGALDPGQYRQITAGVLEAYPNLKTIAVTLRESRSASHNDWSACLHNRDAFLTSRRYQITHIVDRVGSGDSFAAGLIYGLLHLPSHAEALEFAAALSCLKHSIPADFCRVTHAEVQALLQQGGAGRVDR